MRGTKCAVLLAFVAGCVSAPPVAPAAPSQHPPLHPVLLAYVSTLEAWTTEDERTRALAVDLDDTLDGDSQRLRYLAADRVVRRLLPLALEARGTPEHLAHAMRLRAL